MLYSTYPSLGHLFPGEECTLIQLTCAGTTCTDGATTAFENCEVVLLSDGSTYFRCEDGQACYSNSPAHGAAGQGMDLFGGYKSAFSTTVV